MPPQKGMEHNTNLFTDAQFLAVPAINFFGLPGYQQDSACSSGLLSGFLSRHCPERARLWLTWLSPLGAWW